MASEGAKGEQPPPLQTLLTAGNGSVETKCELNMDNMSKPELLTLLSIMEGELEARDLVIEALRARRKDVFLQDRYGHFSMTDPFLALQRDFESGPGPKERRAVSASPITILEAVMSHCRKMQERMTAQLAAAESKQKRLELEKLQLQSLEQEHRKLSAQLKDEREKNKHVVMMLVRECKQLAARVVEESQRVEELSSCSEQEGRTSGRLEEELAAERRRSQQMEAEMEKQLAEFDTEREQLRSRLSREESRAADLLAESDNLRQQLKQLRTEQCKDVPSLPPVMATAPAATAVKSKSITSVAVGTDSAICRAIASQTDAVIDNEMPKKGPLTIPVKPAGTNYTSMNLPKTYSAVRGLHHGISHTENGGEGQMSLNLGHSLHSLGTAGTLPTGVSPRVQAARYKFQPSASEQDQNGTAAQGPPSRDLSPNNRDNFAAKQQARHTVTQVLSRFTSPPAGGSPATLRPGLSHSTSEGGPFAGRLGHPQIGIKSPTVARIDRGNPPPIPPKKPGLSQTPSPPHPPIKVLGEPSRSPAVGLGAGPTKSASTPQLPPKPSLDLGGSVPALTASQVGAPCSGRQQGPQTAACVECLPVTNTSSTITTIVSSPSVNPASVPSHSPQHPDSPLAAASGWCPSVVLPLTCGDPVPLDDGNTFLLQAASQGNVTLLSMLLNQDPSKDISHLQQDLTSALFSAAQNGQTECLNLLLSLGASADAPDENGFTPLHIASANGHHGCVRSLLYHGVEVECECAGGQTALILASGQGSVECVTALLDAGANRSHVTAENSTALHAAVNFGHVDPLKLLLYHPSPQAVAGGSADNMSIQQTHPKPVINGSILNHANKDGWTAAHIAASRGYKKCLEVLCSHRQQDIEKRDNCNRTIHDVATDDCKDLLENLDSYRVLVQVHAGSHVLCPVKFLENGTTIGTVTIQRCTSWPELKQILSHLLTSHLQHVCGNWKSQEEPGGAERSLGLSIDSVASVKIGGAVWTLGHDLPQSPWDLIRKRLSQRIFIHLKGLSECSLDEMTYDCLIPLQLLQNYVRLVEQYRNVIFHGLEGSFQEYVAKQISQYVKHRQETMGISCDIIHVEVDEGLTKDQLLETFINCGFLVCMQEAARGRCVVVLLEGLERAKSLSLMLENLCEALENRGSLYSLSLNHRLEGLYYFQEGCFMIGTLAKPRLQGADLRLQQHFRWVQLRWDCEPLSSMLGRHLRRKLLDKTHGQRWASDDPVHRTLAWVCSVWQQLNGCLSCLGTPEALLGPHVFFSCPVQPEESHAILKWLVCLWNVVVFPRIEDAVISRVTAKHSLSQRRTLSNKTLSPGQKAVVRAALCIVLNKAVLHSCPLDKSELSQLLPAFRGGCFPLSSVSYSYRKGKRKGRDSGAWRQSNTSPRNKGSLTPGRGPNSYLQGSVCISDTCLLTRGNHTSDGDSSGLSLCSDDEGDLIRELQTLCASKSEPDIHKIALSQEEFIRLPAFSRPVTERKLPHRYTELQGQVSKAEGSLDTTQPIVQQVDSQSAVGHNTAYRVARPKSQLPIPSNRGHLQTLSSTHQASSSSSSRSIRSAQMHSSRVSTSSRTRQIQPNNRNNNQPEEEIWILNSNIHKNNNNP